MVIASFNAQDPRLRVLKQLKRQVLSVQRALADRADTEDDPDKPKELPLGQEQLYSYYSPGLRGGDYKITITQHVEHHEGPNNTIDILRDPDSSPPNQDPTSTQKFSVNAPRFTLPPNIIHQSYPPQGLADHNSVLPHIVFEDVHFPWEQQGSPAKEATDAEREKANPEDPKLRARGKVPWVALLTFTEDELVLTNAQLQPKTAGGLFPAPPGAEGWQQDKSTFKINMTMKDYLEIGGDLGIDGGGNNIPTPATAIIPILDNMKDDRIDRKQDVDVVFIPRSHFETLVSPYTDNGELIPIPVPGGKQIPSDVSRYQWLAHVRNVNTRDMANTGVDDNGLYSVVNAHRTGPLDLTAPKPIIVHLVSLEGIENHLKLPLDNAKSHVALISLFSWTYLCLPPEDDNFIDTMRGIGEKIKQNESWLRAPTSVFQPRIDDPQLNSSTNPADIMKLRVAKRIRDGYVLQRYLLQSGEESVCFYRSPLSPTYVPPIPRNAWPYQSNYSTDYQILDRKLGVMDITYSAAWQLGRTLGIADQAFTASIVRLRGNIQTAARNSATALMAAPGTIKSKREVLATLTDSINTLSLLSTSAPGVITADTSNRPHFAAPKFALGSSSEPSDPKDVHREFFVQQAFETSEILASAKEVMPFSNARESGNVQNNLPFNEINTPNSTDWQLVQNWILSAMFLRNIPAHYLIPDPSHLPKESIKFFYIDDNWMDAFIDGAFSIGNHLDRVDDVARQSFKQNINRYLQTPYSDKHTSMTYHPQVPCFGFLFRSSVVTAFPNLEIHAEWPGHEPGTGDPDSGPEPTLRLERLDTETLLCLFDRAPGSKYWSASQITISQPAHQQCFKFNKATSQYVQVQFGRMYTTNDPLPNPDMDRYAGIEPLVDWYKGDGVWGEYYDPGSHENVRKRIAEMDLPPIAFDFNSRILILPALAKACNTFLTTNMTLNGKKYYDDDNEPLATSAVTEQVLTSHNAKMKILVPVAQDPAQNPGPVDHIDQPRQIRMPTTQKSLLTRLTTSDNIFEEAEQPEPEPSSPPPATSEQEKEEQEEEEEEEEEVAPALPYITPSSRPTGLDRFYHPDYNPWIPGFDSNEPLGDGDNIISNKIDPRLKVAVFPLGQKPPTGVKPFDLYMFPDFRTRNPSVDLVMALSPITLVDQPDFYLYSITVEIPKGNTMKDLVLDYVGPGGNMLLNPRFNVHISETKKAIQFTLIPRATSRLVLWSQIPDMSFVIWRVDVNGVFDAGFYHQDVSINIMESYRRKAGNKYVVETAKNAGTIRKVNKEPKK